MTKLRHYVVLRTNAEVARLYFSPDRAEADAWAASYIARHVYGPGMTRPPFETADRPSADVSADLRSAEMTRPPFQTADRPSAGVSADLRSADLKRSDSKPAEVVVALNVTGDGKKSEREVVDDIIKAAAEDKSIFVGTSADIPFGSADHWCGGGGAGVIFSDRSAAEKLIGVDYLRRQNRTSGQHVNVVIVDQGLDSQLLGNSYGDGWTVGTTLPGSTRPPAGSLRRSHGMMMAHNILKAAPGAKLFDMPLIPPRILDIPVFLSAADAVVRTMRTDIANWRNGRFPGPWIIVNAWSIYDRASEYPPGNYTENPNNPFNQLMVDLVSDKIDVIFVAGNCGQFCPDGRCTGLDKGPGRSIWGANSLDAIISVGAVRSDGMWLGYSSQGPGQSALGADKPDFCAASSFHEDDDAFTVNSGTSTACAMTAGVVAALRSRWDQNAVSPGDLKRVLNDTARKPADLAGDALLRGRLGNGILDAEEAFKALP